MKRNGISITVLVSSMVVATTLIASAPGCADPAMFVVEPLRIINWFPSDGDICVDADVTIKVTFSEDVAETLNEGSIYLRDAGGPVATTIAYDQLNFTVVLTPTDALYFNRLYTVVATKDIASVDGGHLAAELEASLQTVPRSGCKSVVECQMSSDCQAPLICARVGVCVDECVTDRDCLAGPCVEGTCTSAVESDVDGGPRGAYAGSAGGDAPSGGNTGAAAGD